MIDDKALGIAGDDWLLHGSCFEPLHEYGEPVTVPPHYLDSIASLVNEHEVVSKTNVACELGLNDGHETIVRPSHVDITHVEIDSRCSIDRQHRISLSWARDLVLND